MKKIDTLSTDDLPLIKELLLTLPVAEIAEKFDVSVNTLWNYMTKHKINPTDLRQQALGIPAVAFSDMRTTPAYDFSLLCKHVVTVNKKPTHVIVPIDEYLQIVGHASA